MSNMIILLRSPARICISVRQVHVTSYQLKYKKKVKVQEIHPVTATYDVLTLPGAKKDTSIPLPKVYSSKFTQAAWYDWWVSQGYFKPNQSDEKFYMLLPPPNVTGKLHIGHAFTNSIQDALVRWNRMCGRSTVWIPGVDHAGIATQVVVEKQLKRDQGLYRHEVSREEFVNRIWAWKEHRTEEILSQLKYMGLSLDWSRMFFTMDKSCGAAVTEAFVKLYDDGLITRKKRMVNWSCKLKSAIADIEVDNISIEGPTAINVPDQWQPVVLGYLTHFIYKIPDSDEEIEVATTRLETMLGDTGIAVNPTDSRYTHLIGKRARHPFSSRSLPIIADEIVKPELGTGAVKLTPAHSSIDHEVALRHNLPHIDILTDDGLITNCGATFDGMKRFDARERVAQSLQKLGLWRGQTEHQFNVPICSRTRDIIEPRLKEQWFLDVRQMAKSALEASESGAIRFTPPYYSKLWKTHMLQTQDIPWCVSRQLWWGHQIPAYKVLPANEEKELFWVAARSTTEAVDKAKEKLGGVAEFQLVRDEDVLDTWFSSALLPFSSLGWPRQTADLTTFYPGQSMESGCDILFFWVARMVWFGQYFMKKLPFDHVILHSLLLSQGEKMSKSKGNVIDPMSIINGSTLDELRKSLEESNIDRKEMAEAFQEQKLQFGSGIPECGTDALRMALCSVPFKGSAINLNVESFVECRNLGNKIWQVYKFFSQYFNDQNIKPLNQLNFSKLCPIDKWMLHRTAILVETCEQQFPEAGLDVITSALKQYWTEDISSVYLECIKSVLKSEDGSSILDSLSVAVHSLDVSLKCLSPFMPFLAEELYQRLPVPDKAESICIASFPRISEWTTYKSEQVDKQMEHVQQIQLEVTRFKQLFNMNHRSKKVGTVYVNGLPHNIPHDLVQVLSSLARLENLHIEKTVPPKAKTVHLAQLMSCVVHIDLSSNLKELKELDKMITKLHDVLITETKLLSEINSLDLQSMSEYELSKHMNKIESMKNELALTELCADYIMRLV